MTNIDEQEKWELKISMDKIEHLARPPKNQLYWMES